MKKITDGLHTFYEGQTVIFVGDSDKADDGLIRERSLTTIKGQMPNESISIDQPVDDMGWLGKIAIGWTSMNNLFPLP